MKEPIKEPIKVYEDEDYVFYYSMAENYKETQMESRREFFDTIADIVKAHYKHLVKKEKK
ncbi:hypothetical protein ACTNEO_14315 [Gracilibacillus sp. HCP3S3_G5_1]|uniref:hypothetical protein n=1 Tax=unclassified Gracilibacillus TaxID=2625209 RepID=UPI003F8C3E76